MSEERFMTYSVLRCVDERRDEALNIGVIALDSEHGTIAVRITPDLSRVARTLPNISAAHIQEYVQALPDFFESQARVLTPEALYEMSREWGNGVRLSGPRSIAATDQASALDSLFAQYVTIPSAPSPDGALVRPDVATATSRRIVRQVVSRLRRRGFRQGEDYQPDAEIAGRTRNQKPVPVWFPLLVSRRLLVDTMEIKEDQERRSVDAARLLATKADEVFRSPSRYDVSIVVRESPQRKLNKLVQSLIMDEAAVDGRAPTIFWQANLEEFIASVPDPQLTMFDSGAAVSRRTTRRRRN